MRANRALVAASFLAAIATVVPRAAQAEPRSYRGTHPVDLDGHWHFDDSVHVHDDLPVGLGPFADFDGVLVFLADPEAFPGEVTSYAYDGTHPLPARFGTAYCGRDGVHSHPFIPEGDYRNEDGVYHFSGALHGGALEVWSAPGEGSNFRLTLPRRRGVTRGPSPLPLEPDDVGGAQASLGDARRPAGGDRDA